MYYYLYIMHYLIIAFWRSCDCLFVQEAFLAIIAW